MALIDRTDAGALIPEEVSREIFRHMPASSAALTMFRQVRMSRKSYRQPVLTALPEAYWVDGDTGQKTTSNAAWENKYLTAEELAVIVPIPEAVMEDADYNITAEIMPDIAEAFGKALDAAVFFGTNIPASWPDDIVTAATAASNTLDRFASTDTIDVDISNVMGLVEADGYDATGFVALRTLKAALRGLRDTVGQPVLGASNMGGSLSADTLYGVDIAYARNGSWDATLADLIAFDRSQFLLGIRTDLTYKILTEAVITDGAGAVVYSLAEQDMVALRVKGRFAFQCPNPINREEGTEADRYPAAVWIPGGA